VICRADTIRRPSIPIALPAAGAEIGNLSFILTLA
jgi:hypothetical protein